MDFFDKLKEFFVKGTEASKNAIEKAGSAVQEFSDKNVLKIEIKKLENSKDKVYVKIGKMAADKFMSGSKSFSSSEEELQNLLDELKKIDEEISVKKNELAEKEKSEPEPETESESESESENTKDDSDESEAKDDKESE